MDFHARAAGGLEVGMVVADHPGGFRSVAGALHGGLQGQGRGLEFGGIAAAEDRGEERPTSRSGPSGAARGGGFVGDEGEIVAGGAQRAQAGVHAGIGRRAVGQTFGIGGGNFLRGQVRIDGGSCEGALGRTRTPSPT
jgi:hypothetical protein